MLRAISVFKCLNDSVFFVIHSLPYQSAENTSKIQINYNSDIVGHVREEGNACTTCGEWNHTDASNCPSKYDGSKYVSICPAMIRFKTRFSAFFKTKSDEGLCSPVMGWAMFIFRGGHSWGNGHNTHVTWSREMSHLSKILILIFLNHFLVTLKCFILMQTLLRLYIWLQSYEGFVAAKNNIKERNLNTVFANISKITSPTSDSFLLIMSHITIRSLSSID